MKFQCNQSPRGGRSVFNLAETFSPPSINIEGRAASAPLTPLRRIQGTGLSPIAAPY